MLQFIFSTLAALIAWILAAIIAALGVIDFFSGRADAINAGNLFLNSASLFLIGALLLPSAALGLRRVLGRNAQAPFGSTWSRVRFNRLALILLVPVMAIGAIVSQSENFAWLLLPPTHLVAASLVVAWLVWIATRSLDKGSSQRGWGVFASGLILSPILAFGSELLIAGIFLLLAILYFGSRPELLIALEGLIDLANISIPDQDLLLTTMKPFLSDPMVIVLVLAFTAIAVPMIEELFKPIGVWLLLRRKLSPANGFALGVLSGAGFALFENLTLGASFDVWLPVMTARIGTTAMHLFTAGLTGWALVIAKNEKRYLRAIGTYFVSVSLHGLWNGMVILGSFASLGELSGAILLPAHLILSTLLVLLVLAIGCVGLLSFANRHLSSTKDVTNSPAVKDVNSEE